MPAFVQKLGSANKTSATSVAITVGANTTVGNMVSVGARITGGLAISSVADTRGNTWSIDSQSSSTQANAGLASCIVASGKQILSGDTITVTFSGSGNCGANAAEYSGVAVSGGAAVVDQAASAHAGTTSVTVATTTDSAAGDLAITCAAGSINSGTLTITASDPDSGGTWTDLAYTGADCAYQLGAATPSLYSATWAESSATNVSAVLVTYQAASTGPSGPLAITVPAPAISISGAVAPAGPLSLTLPRPAAALTGTVAGPVSGTLTITLPGPATALAGTIPPPLIIAMAAAKGTDPYGNQILQGANFGPVKGAHFGIDKNGNLYLADSTGSTRLYFSPGETFAGFYGAGGHSSGAYPLLAMAATATSDHGNSIPGGITLTALPLLIYAGTPAKGSLIFSATPGQLTDPYGNTVPEGLWARNTGGWSGGLSMSTGTSDERLNAFLATVVGNPGAANQQLQLALWSAQNVNHPESSLIWMGSASDDGTLHAFGILAWYDSSGGYHATAQWDPNGLTIHAGTITAQAPGATTPTPETWHNLATPAGWTDATGTGQGLRYKLLPDNTVMVYLNLTSPATAPADGTQIGTIPAGWAPALAQGIPVTVSAAGSSSQSPHISITPAGAIKVWGIGASATVQASGTYPLD